MSVTDSQSYRIVKRGPERFDLMRGDVSLGEFKTIKEAGKAAGKDGVGPDQRIPIVDTYPTWWEQFELLKDQAGEMDDTGLLMKTMFAFKDASFEAGGYLICGASRDQYSFDANSAWSEKHQIGLAWLHLLMDRIKAADDAKAAGRSKAQEPAPCSN